MITKLNPNQVPPSSAASGILPAGTNLQYWRGDNTWATLPTTLPASDVYAWAKAATKPTYTYTEVGADPAGAAAAITLSGLGGVPSSRKITSTIDLSADRNLTYSDVGAAPLSHTQAVSTISDATTVGQNLVKLANPSAITFIRINAANTVTALSASAFLTAIGGAAIAQTMFIGTTSVAINRSSGNLNLTGIGSLAVGAITTNTTLTLQNAQTLTGQVGYIEVNNGFKSNATILISLASGYAINITATTGQSLFVSKCGTAGTWQMGQNMGTVGLDDDFGFYSATWGSGNGYKPIFNMHSDGMSTFYAGLIVSGNTGTKTTMVGSGVTYQSLNVNGSELFVGADSSQESPMFQIVPSYVVSTHASYTSRTIFSQWAVGGAQEVMRMESGASAMIGFYGHTATVRQTGVAVTASGIHAALVNLGLITA
jgi:hypothetical protein